MEGNRCLICIVEKVMGLESEGETAESFCSPVKSHSIARRYEGPLL